MVAGSLVAIDAATGGSLSSGLSKLGGSLLSGLGLGLSATDKRRFAEVDVYATRAIRGDAAAKRQVEFYAFEPTGSPGDARTGTGRSPEKVRNHAKKRLREIVAAGYTLTQPKYYDELKLSPPPSLAAQVLQPILSGAAEAARPVVQQEVNAAAAATFRKALPYVLAAVLLAVVVAFALRRKV